MKKQYLIVEVASALGSVLEFVPLAGLFTRGAAEEFLQRARQASPKSRLLIQEVGAT
jgi:hypothetical protein